MFSSMNRTMQTRHNRTILLFLEVFGKLWTEQKYKVSHSYSTILCISLHSFMFETFDFGLIYILLNHKRIRSQWGKPLPVVLLVRNFCNLKESSFESVDAQNQHCFMHQKVYNTKKNRMKQIDYVMFIDKYLLWPWMRAKLCTHPTCDNSRLFVLEKIFLNPSPITFFISTPFNRYNYHLLFIIPYYTLFFKTSVKDSQAIW